MAFSLTSTAFEDGAAIPRLYSCEGEDLSPPLAWSEAPEDAKSLALIVDDPDAPSGTFLHWLAWGIDPRSGGLLDGESGYRGPCPPPGHGPHRYFFRLYALDQQLDLAPGASREELEGAMQGHVLAGAELVGTYER
jgi:phosphatidylethanolamine-binding protein (PEBP) family uncharacterized protein